MPESSADAARPPLFSPNLLMSIGKHPLASPLAMGSIVANAASIAMLVVLLVRTASSFSALAADDDGNGKDRGWWDLKREEVAALRVVLTLSALIVLAGSLFLPMARVWHPTRGSCDRYGMGALAASTSLVACALFVGFWMSFGQQEEDDENKNDKNNDGGDYEMDEWELLAYHRKYASTVSLILALVYSGLAVLVYDEGRRIPETAGGLADGDDSTALFRAKAEARAELMRELWLFLSSGTITIFAIIFIVACIVLWGEEDDRRREEGALNLLTVLMWVIIVAVGMSEIGRRILKGRSPRGSLGLGVLSGGTLYYGLMLLFVSGLYVSPEGGRKDAKGSATAASFACFFLGLLHVAFSLGVYKYRESLMTIVPEEVEDDGDVRMGTDGSTGGDFRAMDDSMEPGVQMADSGKGMDDTAEEGGFRRMNNDDDAGSQTGVV